MFKALLRSFVFTLIALEIAREVLGPFDFSNSLRTLLLIALALSILNRYLKTVLDMLSLPDEGVVYLIIFFLMDLVIVNVLAVLISQFSIQDAQTPDLIILGFMIPSKSLSAIYSGMAGSAIVTVVYNFFEWLNSKK
ncbi:hypothetical protein C4561_00410 [candidate division WWE3 bacterium]|jgi:uncharacterized membrane protein YvlD (DUF360 family)|uniref:Uncharacterized protein n=1 Tax=candidate division WWE3 bacterium TaxID=2053526 RepID=A0A3A4ZNH0_UNCKA|nr:MAG: hypothetical protein C4561_00410 [candidate division WWE3 bacterium]